MQTLFTLKIAFWTMQSFFKLDFAKNQAALAKLSITQSLQ